MKSKKFIVGALALVLALGSALAFSTSVLAADANTKVRSNGARPGLMRGLGNKLGQFGQRAGMKPVVFGTVSAINGNILTINGRQGFGTTTPAVTFTVDATKAKIIKNNATSSVASIVIGDTVLVQGTISGTNVTATIIRDGALMRGLGERIGDGHDGTSSPKFERDQNRLNGSTTGEHLSRKGFLVKTGQFFRNLFGF